jgi:hypothetical protein
LAFIGGVPATLKVTERFEALEQRGECAGFQKEFFSEAAERLIVPLPQQDHDKVLRVGHPKFIEQGLVDAVEGVPGGIDRKAQEGIQS